MMTVKEANLKRRERALRELEKQAQEEAIRRLSHSDRALRSLLRAAMRTAAMVPYSQRREFREPEWTDPVVEARQQHLYRVLVASRGLTICQRLEPAEYPSHRREIYHIASVYDDRTERVTAGSSLEAIQHARRLG